MSVCVNVRAVSNGTQHIILCLSPSHLITYRRMKSNIYTPYQNTAQIQHVTLILSICTVRLTNVLTLVRYQNTAEFSLRDEYSETARYILSPVPKSWFSELSRCVWKSRASKQRNVHPAIWCPSRSITPLQTARYSETLVTEKRCVKKPICNWMGKTITVIEKVK